jgi:hypothetical protein
MDYVDHGRQADDRIACLALRHRDKIVARNEGIIAANLAAVQRGSGSTPTSCRTPPQGGLPALIRYDMEIPSWSLPTDWLLNIA